MKIYGIRPEDTKDAPCSFCSNSLDYLCGQLDIPQGTHHRAGDDAEMCARLFF